MINKIIIFLIKSIRPLLGSYGACRFAFSCYDFGIMQYKEQSFSKATWETLKRILSCNPFNNI